MQTDRRTTHRIRRFITMATLAVGLVAWLGSDQTSASAGVFENGEYWIGSYRGELVDPEPVIEFGTLNIVGNTWDAAGMRFPGDDPYTIGLSIDSITPVANGYYHVLGTRDVSEDFDVTVAAVPTLFCETPPLYENETGMTLGLPKATAPVTDDFDGHWKHFCLESGIDDNEQPYAWSSIANIELNAATGEGTHQYPGEPADPFDWSVDTASATFTVTLGTDEFEIGVGREGMMFRAGPQIRTDESDPRDLALELFLKTNTGRVAEEVVGRYALQFLSTDEELSHWFTSRGILSINADGTFHVEFEPNAAIGRPDGWTDDGTWTMDDTGRVLAQSLEGGSPVEGQLSLSGDVLVMANQGEDDDRECQFIVAIQIVPEPSVLFLLISALPVLLLGRRRLK
ncbi:MAG: PEP-CTERM sorting domain-containing protein [Pirellulales bacterium]|nr:PEP-CTERM sorting domain-containing protein [Pirellulales bacterium]